MAIGTAIVRALALAVGFASLALAGCGDEEGGIYAIPAPRLKRD